MLQIQLIQAYVCDLLDLKDMDERGAARTLGHMEGRLVSGTIKVEKFMHIEQRETFMQDLGVDKKELSTELVRNIMTPVILHKICMTKAQDSKG